MREAGSLVGVHANQRKSAYIGGTSFTGSTFLSFLLNAQPNVTSVGEVAWSIPKTNPGSYPCSCSATLDTCPFWLRVGQEMEKRGYLFNADHWSMSFEIAPNKLARQIALRSLGSNFADRIRDNLIRALPGWGRDLTEIGNRNKALIDAIATITGASVFVDASKDHTRLRLLREYCDPDLYIIHLVRDSPAFVHSCITKRKHPVPFHNAIRWWNSMAWNMERLRLATAPQRWLLVRHEDICADPGGEVERILRFLGAWSPPAILGFRSASHHIIGNLMRLESSSQVRLNTSWRTGLAKAQLDEILRRTGYYRQRLGYSDGDGT